jgi:hypothetical protein
MSRRPILPTQMGGGSRRDNQQQQQQHTHAIKRSYGNSPSNTYERGSSIHPDPTVDSNSTYDPTRAVKSTSTNTTLPVTKSPFFARSAAKDTFALQFVPSYQESAATSWDAAACLEEKKESGAADRLVLSSPTVSKTNSKIHTIVTPDTSVAKKTGRGRIASMFSTNPSAADACHSNDERSEVSPSSPQSSNTTSSSGYIGWPGTQDKRGATVQGSYDDSSVDQSQVMVAGDKRALTSRWKGRSYATSSLQNEHATTRAAAKPFQTNVQQYELENSSDVRFTRSDGVRRDPAVTFSSLFPMNEPPAAHGDNYPQSDTSMSKTSSAYLQVKDVNDMDYPEFNQVDDDFEEQQPMSNGTIMKYSSTAPDPTWSRRDLGTEPSRQQIAAPTADALKVNDHMSPPHRMFTNTKGFRALIDKTKDVPCLMDESDTESVASSKATSVYSGIPSARSFRGRNDNDSDVFDGVSTSQSDVFDNMSTLSPRKSGYSNRPSRHLYPASIAEEEIIDEPQRLQNDETDFSVVMLGGGLTAIQTDSMGFNSRQTASDYDDNLTNSDVDQYGFAKTPGFNQMISAGKSRDSSLLGIHGNLGVRRRNDTASNRLTGSESGSSSSLFSDPYRQEQNMLYRDLSTYFISPAQMKKVLRKYRKMSDTINTDMSLDEFDVDEDEHKAFALVEMRSRIMAKDIERGLERRGGTTVVDDLVLTPYNRVAQRVRDAVIVSKAWRDGATPKDVIHSALLTRRHDHTYFIKRPVKPEGNVHDITSTTTGLPLSVSGRYFWEPVKWVDDTDISLFRCPSLGARHMRGFEIFTIGDCQSILLRLTNERCIELRAELNEATRRQVEAEELMKEEGDADDGMMTEAEMEYLGSMEEVKIISKELVCAEQSFLLVRERIEKLVMKYEALLSKIDTNSYVGGASSVVTYEGSFVSEQDSEYWDAIEEQERAVWARRAQRAEVKAEVAAREALLAKQEARMIREQKQIELEDLKQKLEELQSESTYNAVDREYTNKLADSFAIRRHADESPTLKGLPDKGPVGVGGINRSNLDAVKQRFRDRMAARMEQKAPPQDTFVAEPRRRVGIAPNKTAAHSSEMRDLFRSAGEEMCQQLDFYERSLRAVDNTREKM